MRPTILIDTLSIFFRSHHGLPPMNTTLGEPTSAVYGFASLLLKVLREQDPSGIAFAVDAPAKTFRHERYEAYKGTREGASDGALQQLARLRQLLAACETPVFCTPGFEADDVLATLARQLRESNAPAMVVSGDRDLLQVARGCVSVLFTGARGKDATLYDEVKVRERYGVSPDRLPSWSALVGDTSDNLPGVPGIGPRTATELVQTFGDSSTLLEGAPAIERPRIREAVLAHREQILLNEQLARLREDVPLPAGPIARPLGPTAFENLRALFAELEFKSLLPRLGVLEERARRPVQP